MTTAALQEADIRPPDLMTQKAKCIERDREFLVSRRHRWVEVNCPACDSAHCSTFGIKHGFTYQRCSDCETVYTSPRPCESLLAEFYTQSANYAFWNEHIFPATEEVRRCQIFQPRAERLAALVRARGRNAQTLLDVGAAFGTFCSEAVRTGVVKHAIALEPTPGLAQTCRMRGLEVIESTLASAGASRDVDIVSAFEVIEHVFNPLEFVRQCARHLHPGGMLVLSCPNVKGFGIEQLGVASGSFDHEHLNYFHPTSLAHLVRRAGLRVIETLTPGQLDADLVRQAILRGDRDVSGEPWLRTVLIDMWHELGASFQSYIARHGLSSHLWIVAEQRSSDQ